MRNAKALMAKARTHEVEPLQTQAGNCWKVKSGGSGKLYVIYLHREVMDRARILFGARCSCPWGMRRSSSKSFRSACSHTLAVWARIIGLELGRNVSAWGDLERALKQKQVNAALGDGVYLTLRLQSAAQGEETQEYLRQTEVAQGFYGNPDYEGTAT